MRALSGCMTDASRPITVAEYEPLGPERHRSGRLGLPGRWRRRRVSLAEGQPRLGPPLAPPAGAGRRHRRATWTTTAFGVALAHPIVVAPTADHTLAHADAERGTARGAAAAGGLFTLSTISSVPMEEVAAAAPDAPRWFQLYAPADRGAGRALVERAAASGFSAVAGDRRPATARQSRARPAQWIRDRPRRASPARAAGRSRDRGSSSCRRSTGTSSRGCVRSARSRCS